MDLDSGNIPSGAVISVSATAAEGDSFNLIGGLRKPRHTSHAWKGGARDTSSAN